MTFFFKRSVVTLDCFTSNPTAYELSKPNHSAKFVPNWWRTIPPYYFQQNSVFQSPTIKGCEGFKGLYAKGAIVPLWSDLMVEIGPKGTDYYQWQFSDRCSDIVIHTPEQMGNYVDTQSVQHFKLGCPWTFKCDADIKWVWIDPVWNRLGKNDFTVLPAIVSFNKIALQGNVNLFFYREENPKVMKINHGEPIFQLVPLTEKKLKIKHHLVSEQEMQKLHIFEKSVAFYNRYKYVKKLLQRKMA